jgi:hypothetical protein
LEVAKGGGGGCWGWRAKGRIKESYPYTWLIFQSYFTAPCRVRKLGLMGMFDSKNFGLVEKISQGHGLKTIYVNAAMSVYIPAISELTYEIGTYQELVGRKD